MKLSMPEPQKPSKRFRLMLFVGFLLLAALGALYWHSSGQITLQGRISGTLLPAGPEVSGRISRIAVGEGEHVVAGQTLLLLENASLQEVFFQEQQVLLQIEASIPPQALKKGVSEDALTLRLEAEQQAEQDALLLLHEAAAEEARAAVAARRAAILHGDRKMTEDQYQEALLAHGRAKRVVETARADHEKKSLTRAATAGELRQLRDAVAAPDQDAIAMLLKAREAQAIKVQAAAAALNATVLRAPVAGVVAGVIARPGAAITAGETAMFLMPLPASPTVVAYASDQDASKLRIGQKCSITVPGRGSFDGVITAVLPRLRSTPQQGNASDKEEGDKDAAGLPTQVHVRILPEAPTALQGNATAAGENAAGEAVPFMFTEGAKVDVTVHLRETAN